jgi:pimeloyl-ACP methyl ester carboxylesterase
MTNMARAIGNWSLANGRHHIASGRRGAGRSPGSTAAPGRLVRALVAIMLAALATAFAVGPASPAWADPITCTGADVPFTVAGQPVTMHGTLCRPNDPTDTVVMLLHGGTYNHVYWDFPLEPNRYNFRRGLNLAGLATFVVDRLGTGLSSRPPSTDVTAQAAVAGFHVALQMLRAGAIGGTAFPKVVLGGHSFGSFLAVGEVATYPGDADAVLLTGFSHNVSPEGVGRVIASFYPAAQDPAFAQAQPPYDDGYVTTMPGTRQNIFYAPATADPAVVALDEATKDVLSLTESNTSGAYLDPAVSQAIQVPVLILNGEFDTLFVCPNGPPCTAGQYLAQESQFFSAQACLQTFVLSDAGHSLNLFPKAHQAWNAAAEWIEAFVVDRPPSSTTCP